jgi:26S proteasome regulatory subunit N7
MDYRAFTFYTVLACLRSLGRSALKKRVIDSPDVLSAIGDVPHLAPTLTAFYEGRYRDFLEALTALYPALVRDRYLSRHAPFFLREMRCAAYGQYLESYKSVTLGGMAGAFGVGPAFLDAELSRFIACGRINAKIDAVAGACARARLLGGCAHGGAGGCVGGGGAPSPTPARMCMLRRHDD